MCCCVHRFALTHMCRRRYFFEQVAGVIAESRRPVPVFTDKHFAYSWTDAAWMWERANELSIPLMAGSCLPVGAWRRPFLEHPKEQHTLLEAVAVGYGRGGPVGTKGGSFEACEYKIGHTLSVRTVKPVHFHSLVPALSAGEYLRYNNYAL